MMVDMKTIKHEIEITIYDDKTIDIRENGQLIEKVTAFKIECKLNELPIIKLERYLC